MMFGRCDVLWCIEDGGVHSSVGLVCVEDVRDWLDAHGFVDRCVWLYGYDSIGSPWWHWDRLYMWSGTTAVMVSSELDRVVGWFGDGCVCVRVEFSV